MADEQQTSIIENQPGGETYPETIYLVQEGDAVKGGAEGIANKQATGLAKRCQWLRAVLIQFNGIVGSLMAQIISGDVTAAGSGVGNTVSNSMVNCSVENVSATMCQIALTSLTDPYTADVYIKHIKAVGGQDLIRKTGLVLDVNVKVNLFDEAISFDDLVEVMVYLTDSKGAEFKFSAAENGKRVQIWGRSLTYIPA